MKQIHSSEKVAADRLQDGVQVKMQGYEREVVRQGDALLSQLGCDPAEQGGPEMKR